MTKAETEYQNRLIKKLQDMFPGCFIMKNNPDEIQGIPDLLVLYGCAWAMLEVKVSARAAVQPNQEWYIDTFRQMSYASFIYPENEDQVLHDLQFAFGS